MRTLHIIMPMAGEGSRFMRKGWQTPKPLIKLKEKPLFMRAISSIRIESIPVKYSFIVREEHIESYNIDQVIKTYIPEANIFTVKETTRGAVETCMLAKEVFNEEDSILVLDCDLEFKSEAFNSSIKAILSNPIHEVNGGLLASFKACDNRYSYAEIDSSNNVLRTTEKEPISDNALCGAYFFSTTNGFTYAANKLLRKHIMKKNEFYVSLLYNILLEEGENVKLCSLDEYHSYGTPEELNRYL